ncbi:poly-beta-1,6-N-acetyl-D-glucosamine N-deacetylase PgaB [Acinetobacter indicus]
MQRYWPKKIQKHQQQRTDNDRPQKIMHVDIDYIYDPDPQRRERNYRLIRWTGLSRLASMPLYLQAFSDPDGNGSGRSGLFPEPLYSNACRPV